MSSDKMSAVSNYKDRTAFPLFGDAGTAVMLEPAIEDVGIIDYIHHVNRPGRHHLHMKAGGSLLPAS